MKIVKGEFHTLLPGRWYTQTVTKTIWLKFLPRYDRRQFGKLDADVFHYSVVGMRGAPKGKGRAEGLKVRRLSLARLHCFGGVGKDEASTRDDLEFMP